MKTKAWAQRRGRRQQYLFSGAGVEAPKEHGVWENQSFELSHPLLSQEFDDKPTRHKDILNLRHMDSINLPSHLLRTLQLLPPTNSKQRVNFLKWILVRRVQPLWSART